MIIHEVPQEYSDISREDEIALDKKTLDLLRFRYLSDEKFRLQTNKEIASWKRVLKDQGARQRGSPKKLDPLVVYIRVTLKRRDDGITLELCFQELMSDYDLGRANVQKLYYLGEKLFKKNPALKSLI
jgi:hypothetical protein